MMKNTFPGSIISLPTDFDSVAPSTSTCSPFRYPNTLIASQSTSSSYPPPENYPSLTQHVETVEVGVEPLPALCYYNNNRPTEESFEAMSASLATTTYRQPPDPPTQVEAFPTIGMEKHTASTSTLQQHIGAPNVMEVNASHLSTGQPQHFMSVVGGAQMNAAASFWNQQTRLHHAVHPTTTHGGGVPTSHTPFTPTTAYYFQHRQQPSQQPSFLQAGGIQRSVSGDHMLSLHMLGGGGAQTSAPSATESGVVINRQHAGVVPPPHQLVEESGMALVSKKKRKPKNIASKQQKAASHAVRARSMHGLAATADQQFTQQYSLIEASQNAQMITTHQGFVHPHYATTSLVMLPGGGRVVSHPASNDLYGTNPCTSSQQLPQHSIYPVSSPAGSLNPPAYAQACQQQQLQRLHKQQQQWGSTSLVRHQSGGGLMPSQSMMSAAISQSVNNARLTQARIPSSGTMEQNHQLAYQEQISLIHSGAVSSSPATFYTPPEFQRQVPLTSPQKQQTTPYVPPQHPPQSALLQSPQALCRSSYPLLAGGTGHLPIELGRGRAHPAGILTPPSSNPQSNGSDDSSIPNRPSSLQDCRNLVHQSVAEFESWTHGSATGDLTVPLYDFRIAQNGFDMESSETQMIVAKLLQD